MKTQKVQYKQIIEKPSPTGNFNLLDYFNEIGAQGWRIITSDYQVEKLALPSSNGELVDHYTFWMTVYRVTDEEVTVEDGK